MMRASAAAVGLLVCALAAAGARADERASAGENARAQATQMYDAFVRGDDDTFVAFTEPRLVALLGGKARTTILMKKARLDMRSVGWVIESATVSAPQQVVLAGMDKIQAVLPAEVVYRKRRGKVHVPSFLVGFSSDGGKTWKFIDTGRLGEDTIRKTFPECSAALRLPSQPKAYETRK
jgi:hypothetical protein